MSKLLFPLPPLIVASTIFYFSSLESVDFIHEVITIQDKFLHITAYCVLGITLIFASLGILKNTSKRNIIIFVILLGALYGISDEIHQSFVPGRNADVFDWLADLIGIGISFIFYPLILKLVNKIQKHINV